MIVCVPTPIPVSQDFGQTCPGSALCELWHTKYWNRQEPLRQCQKIVILDFRENAPTRKPSICFLHSLQIVINVEWSCRIVRTHGSIYGKGIICPSLLVGMWLKVKYGHTDEWFRHWSARCMVSPCYVQGNCERTVRIKTPTWIGCRESMSKVLYWQGYPRLTGIILVRCCGHVTGEIWRRRAETYQGITETISESLK